MTGRYLSEVLDGRQGPWVEVAVLELRAPGDVTTGDLVRHAISWATEALPNLGACLREMGIAALAFRDGMRYGRDPLADDSWHHACERNRP